jgi:ABC-2 type transport system permease protein
MVKEFVMKRLWTTFRYTFTGLRWQTLGWGLGLAFYGVLIISMYDTFGAQQDQLQQLIASYPPEFLAFFGAEPTSMLTPAGFLGMYAFSMLPIIVGIFAVISGSGLIVSDEEHGRLDLIIAHPVGRHPFFWSRLFGLLGAALAIMFLGWLGFCVMLGGSNLGFNWGQMAVPFLSMLLQTLVYTTLALLLSMLLPSRSLAAMLAGAIMVISYFLSSLSFMDERLEMVASALPYHYYQIVLSFQELNLAWLFALLGSSLAMALLAWALFLRRDIRLSGEGSWRRR